MTEKPPAKLRDRRAYPVFYMFAVTFVSTGVLIGLNRMTEDRVEANRQVLFEEAVLFALGWDAEEKMSPAGVHQAFLENVQEPAEESAGAYRLVRGGKLEAYALPFEGRGFWNQIKGVMGIRPDGSVLTGMAFYEQSETPGLGAEIVKTYFTDQFQELKLDAGSPALALKSSGAKSGENEVDAITGATQTCTRLEDILNNALDAWRKKMGLSKSGDDDAAAGKARGEG